MRYTDVEKQLEGLERVDLDVSIEQRSSELEGSQSDSGKANEGRAVAVLDDLGDELPRDGGLDPSRRLGSSGSRSLRVEEGRTGGK